MLKVLKWIGILLLVFIGLLAVLGYSAHQPLPEGKAGPRAEQLAKAMQDAINIEAWDSTRFVQWSFPRGHDYLWDKTNNLVEVKWEDNKVLLRTKTVDGLAFSKGQQLDGEAADKLISTAWALFCNDSFWLNAPAKAFDPGTERKVVEQASGRPALMVQYTSGGVTPGDAYLWTMGDDGRPSEWKMWVDIIPIGGVSFSWEDWKQLSTGAWVATTHASKLYTMELTNIKGGMTLADVGRTDTPFTGLTN